MSIHVTIQQVTATIHAVSIAAWLRVTHPLMNLTYVAPVIHARLDEQNSYTHNDDGLVHRTLYCTPSYFAEDYVVKPNYI